MNRSFSHFIACCFLSALCVADLIMPVHAARFGSDDPGEIGDLIFRSSKNGKMYGIDGETDPWDPLKSGHVGIYIGKTNCDTINAPKTGDVVKCRDLNMYDDAYYCKYKSL